MLGLFRRKKLQVVKPLSPLEQTRAEMIQKIKDANDRLDAITERARKRLREIEPQDPEHA